VVAQQLWVVAFLCPRDVPKVPVALIVLVGDAEGQLQEEAYCLCSLAEAQPQSVQ
jgi:hypothetical protein